MTITTMLRTTEAWTKESLFEVDSEQSLPGHTNYPDCTLLYSCTSGDERTRGKVAQAGTCRAIVGLDRWDELKVMIAISIQLESLKSEVANLAGVKFNEWIEIQG